MRKSFEFLSTDTKFSSSSWLVLIDTGRTQITVVRDTLRYNFHGLHGHTDLSTRNNTDAKLSDLSALSHESHQPARDFIFLASPG